MRVDAEAATGAVWAAKGDPRVTRLGRFLRNTRLDELPQCINVLRGEMSIVGPRPERPVFFTRLEDDIPFYAERTYGLKPGVTGLAQVSTGYDSSIDDVRLKILFDHSYALLIRSPWQCIKTDFLIILRTILVMGLGMGR
jgi:lipopolysaccharide/colanic/teichoic acid biosynthesis glycosyltransferase